MNNLFKRLIITILYLIMYIFFNASPVLAISEIEAKQYIGKHISLVLDRENTTLIVLEGTVIDIINTTKGKKLLLNTSYLYSEDNYIFIALEDIAKVIIK